MEECEGGGGGGRGADGVWVRAWAPVFLPVEQGKCVCVRVHVCARGGNKGRECSGGRCLQGEVGRWGCCAKVADNKVHAMDLCKAPPYLSISSCLMYAFPMLEWVPCFKYDLSLCRST